MTRGSLVGTRGSLAEENPDVVQVVISLGTHQMDYVVSKLLHIMFPLPYVPIQLPLP